MSLSVLDIFSFFTDNIQNALLFAVSIAILWKVFELLFD
jgi:hypothetical protein